eukprot:5608226-Pyramimonas_sp.AAC.1
MRGVHPKAHWLAERPARRTALFLASLTAMVVVSTSSAVFAAQASHVRFQIHLHDALCLST